MAQRISQVIEIGSYPQTPGEVRSARGRSKLIERAGRVQ